MSLSFSVNIAQVAHRQTIPQKQGNHVWFLSCARESCFFSPLLTIIISALPDSAKAITLPPAPAETLCLFYFLFLFVTLTLYMSPHCLSPHPSPSLSLNVFVAFFLLSNNSPSGPFSLYLSIHSLHICLFHPFWVQMLSKSLTAWVWHQLPLRSKRLTSDLGGGWICVHVLFWVFPPCSLHISS